MENIFLMIGKGLKNAALDIFYLLADYHGWVNVTSLCRGALTFVYQTILATGTVASVWH